MVVHNVEENVDVVGMGSVDKLLELFRPTVTFVDSEPINTVVAPVALTAERLHGHELDCGNSQVNEVIKLIDDPRKRPLRRKRTHVELVDDLALELFDCVSMIRPRKVRAEDF